MNRFSLADSLLVSHKMESAKIATEFSIKPEYGLLDCFDKKWSIIEMTEYVVATGGKEFLRSVDRFIDKPSILCKHQLVGHALPESFYFFT